MIFMRTLVISCLYGAIALTAIGFAQAPSVAAPVRGSASVRVPAWRQLRTAVESLMGWQVGVSLGSFRHDTFMDAARKAEALDLAVFEGDGTQKVSLQIPKDLDYRLAPGERESVRERMLALNVRMPVYDVGELSEDETIRRKQIEFAKALGVETVAVDRVPASLAAIETLADEFGVTWRWRRFQEQQRKRFRAADGGSACMPISASGRRAASRSATAWRLSAID